MKSIRAFRASLVVAALTAPLLAQEVDPSQGETDPPPPITPGQGQTGPPPPGDPVDQSGIAKRAPGYTGPGDSIPPPDLPPPGGDVPPPPDPGSGNPPGPGTPPGGLVPPPLGGTVTPTAPVFGPVAPGLLPTTTTGGLVIDLTRWSWWWELNKEPFLRTARERMPMPAYTAGDGTFLGRSRPTAAGPPTPAEIHGRVVPALLRNLERARSSDLLSSTLLALARIGAHNRPDARRGYEEVLRGFVSHSNARISEAALIALGVLGDASSAPVLGEVLLGTGQGRRAIGNRRPSTRTRAFAAYALGLLGHQSANEDARRYVVHQLVRALEDDRLKRPELQAACVTALGLVPLADSAPLQSRRLRRLEGPRPATSSLAAQVGHLLDLLGSRRIDTLVRAQIPTALGRLVQGSDGERSEELRILVVESLLERIAARKREPNEVIQSCVIALGMVGDNDDDDIDGRIRRTLIRIEDLTNDLPARTLALIALGRVGGRPGTGPPASDLKDTRRYLVHELARGGTTMRPWAALALGVVQGGAVENGMVPDRGTTASLLAALDDARSPNDVGACALGAGLLGDPSAEELLGEKLADFQAEDPRAYVALSLGMVGARPALERLRAILGGSFYRPLLLRDTAIALDLLRDPRAPAELVLLLDRAVGLAAQSAVSESLGRAGDRTALDPLLELFGDESRPDRVRAEAASALGWLVDNGELPWTAFFSVDLNYHAAPLTLFDPRGPQSNSLLDLL
ncbi:MAG: hypothetical protein O7B99_00615 [Planctomycetota bacterium]|nr:hypothetical protein [Planctomycetota bacterium]